MSRVSPFDPQLSRLVDAIENVESEVKSIQSSSTDSWKPQALDHLDRARAAASKGNTDTGWSQVHRALEFQALASNQHQLRAASQALSIEVRSSGKVNKWRRDAILELLDPILQYDGLMDVDLNEWRVMLSHALRLRNEGFENDYWHLTILRRHQKRLLIIGVLAALAVIAVLVLAKPSTAHPIADWTTAVASVAMGVLGSATSAAQRSTHESGSRIPKFLSSHVASLSRVVIGGVAGLLAWLGLISIVQPVSVNLASVLIATFSAGFAERLLVQGDKRGDSSLDKSPGSGSST